MPHDAPIRTTAASAAWAWTRLTVVVAARGVVAVLLGLALWAAGPAALGWHVTTVASDSMRPAIAAGDVVAARPTPAQDLRPGQVLLATDPDHADRLRCIATTARAPRAPSSRAAMPTRGPTRRRSPPPTCSASACCGSRSSDSPSSGSSSSGGSR